ncbi:hypothetical protein CVT25_006626 [Psilocybe cyanescens]|uniref:Uncharacterized protein n=1 Tax=Psilocybe cyanescens TaxID=93625 RepID=A0A409XIP2_PSICY|nr:hypothetical protein CVT25_006626 [Psilocybe cyanescens]
MFIAARAGLVLTSNDFNILATQWAGVRFAPSMRTSVTNVAHRYNVARQPLSRGVVFSVLSFSFSDPHAGVTTAWLLAI